MAMKKRGGGMATRGMGAAMKKGGPILEYGGKEKYSSRASMKKHEGKESMRVEAGEKTMRGGGIATKGKGVALKKGGKVGYEMGGSVVGGGYDPTKKSYADKMAHFNQQRTDALADLQTRLARPQIQAIPDRVARLTYLQNYMTSNPNASFQDAKRKYNASMGTGRGPGANGPGATAAAAPAQGTFRKGGSVMKKAAGGMAGRTAPAGKPFKPISGKPPMNPAAREMVKMSERGLSEVPQKQFARGGMTKGRKGC